MAKPTPEEMLEKIMERDRRYAREAYAFVHEALQFTVQRIGRKGHVTGRELCEGLCDFALAQFGRLARTVLDHWGVRRSEDVGEIVFNMVEVGLLKKREEDTREDFADAVKFDEALDRAFELHLKPEEPDGHCGSS
ncbi:MAG: hypothetical protein NTY65_13890 [Planctomycetota bacterium]|jgi:uncharacterized repeat protein (TIGR04138 family)|nr:hypothetical protein [Planctomycetota bacterium]